MCKVHTSYSVVVVPDNNVVGAKREQYILDVDESIKHRVQVPGQLVKYLHGGNSILLVYRLPLCLSHWSIQ